MSQHDDIIRASEIGQYAYCAHAWWLGRVVGHRSANVAAMQAGTARHQAHGRSVAAYRHLRWVGLALLLLAGGALFVWLLLAVGR